MRTMRGTRRWRSAVAVVFAGLIALLSSSCADGAQAHPPRTAVAAVSRIGVPPPPPPRLIVSADGRPLSDTTVTDIPRGRLVLHFTVSPPPGTVVTEFVAGISPALPTTFAAGPGGPVLHGELVLARRGNLHVETPGRFSVIWPSARPGRAFLGVWLVTNSRWPPDTGQEGSDFYPVMVTSG